MKSLHSLDRRAVYKALFVAGMTLAPGAAWAQDAIAGRVVRGSFAPEPGKAKAVLDIGNFSGARPPAGAESVELTIDGVRFEGDVCPLPAAAERLTQALARREGRKLDVAELYDRVHEMEQEIADAGWVLTRVQIPPQQISPGQPVTIRVVNGYIEKIDVSALPEPVREPVEARLSKLVNAPLPRRADIERALLVAGDLGGLSLRSAFAPGDRPGGAKIILEGSFKRVTGTVGGDRQASPSVGGWGANNSFTLNNLLGASEQIYLAYQGDPGTALKANARMRILAGGALYPIGEDGLILSPELVWARIVPISRKNVPDSENKMGRAAARVSYPAVRQVDRTVIGFFAVEAITQRVQATDFGITLSSDSYLALRAGLDAQEILSPMTSLFGSLKISHGLGSIGSVFGVSADANSTHIGARSDFVKLNASVGANAQLGPLGAFVFLRGQTSFGAPLFNSEQLSLDGSDALSSLSPGVYAVDEGAILRGELRHSYAIDAPVAATVTPYAFTAFGAGVIYNATAVENASTRATGAGAGVRARLWQASDQTQSVSVGVEFGRAWISSASRTQASRVNVFLGVNF